MTTDRFGKRNWMILLVFGLVGQIAWSVENMYFNLFVFETVAPSLSTITLMVQLSGITATIATLISGAMSDKTGNRRKYISVGYIVWGISVALFGLLSPNNVKDIFNTDIVRATSITLTLVVVGDCIMTLFGSTANDACFNAWITDNTRPSFRGSVEGVMSILPLVAMLIVAGGFGILVSVIGYAALFVCLGTVISVCGVIGIWLIKDSNTLVKSSGIKEIFYGFKFSVIKSNPTLYITLLVIMVYGIACQIFMPYLIIYMKTYLGFSVMEYSVVFGAAIIFGAIINVFLGRLSDKKNKISLLYIAGAVMAVGLLGMYIFNSGSKTMLLITFGVAGFIMITGYIFISALCGSIVRDNTPVGAVGKLQGVRMVFSVLIPMIVGPMIGNAINKARNNPLSDLGSADIMTTQYIPAPEIFLAGAIITAIMFIFIPLLTRINKIGVKNEIEN